MPKRNDLGKILSRVSLMTLFFCLFCGLALAATPSVGTVSPYFGSSLAGIPVTFTTTYTDTNGWQDIKCVIFLVNTAVSGLNSFYGYYDQNANRLYLRNDANTAWTGGFIPGSSNVIENSYAKLDCLKTTILGSGTTLTVNWNVTFKPKFSGTQTKNLYLNVYADLGAASGYAQKGNWLIGPNSKPALDTVTPYYGSSLPDTPVTFTTTYTDPNSWQDIRYVLFLINTAVNGANSFYAEYDLNNNKLYLRNDANTSWTGGFAPGSSNSIENSYVKLNCSKTTASGSGNTLTVKWNVTFKSSFSNTQTKNIYLNAYDDSNLSSGYAQKGNWLVGSNSAPAVGTLSPSSGSSLANTPLTFTTTYTDSNGWQDIGYAHFLINTTTSSYTNCFYGYYAQNSNKLYIRNDSGTLIGGITPGSKNPDGSDIILENSYTKLNFTKTTASGSGNTLTVKWNTTFKDTFAGVKNVYLYVRDDAGVYQGWVKKGTWEIKSSSPVKINNGLPYTNSNLVTINLYPYADPAIGSPTQMQFSNDNTVWSNPEAYAATKVWTLAPGDDSKTVYVKFMNVSGSWSQAYSDTIILDTVPPSTTDSGISGAWTNSPVTVTLAASDAASAVATPDSYTKLLLRCDGDNGSALFTDASFAGNAVTANGNARIDTAQSKFGGSSAFFDGTNSYLTLPNSDGWNFGTGDSTIDFWVKFNDLSSWAYVIYEQYIDGNNYHGIRLVNLGNGNYSWRFDVYKTGGPNWYVAGDTALSSGAWYHIAVVRSGNRFTIYQNGAQIGVALHSDEIPGFPAQLKIGASSYNGGSQYVNGWLDEFRISKGIARWTGRFSPEVTVNSGVNKTYYSTDGSAPGIAYNSPFTLANEGVYTIKYYSKDNAGNIEVLRTASNQVKIDKTPPAAGSIIINNCDATTDNVEVSLTLSCTDSASGMGLGAEAQLSNDNAAWASPQDYAATATWQLSDGFGVKTVYAKFKDAAGNWSGVVSDTIELLNVPKERMYIYLNNQRVAMEENGKKFFYHNDHLGGANIVTNEAGEQAKRLEYQPFGDTKLEEGSKKLSRKFTGKELDDSTGLYNFLARLYDPKTGRFITADPIQLSDAGVRFAGGRDLQTFLANPQNLNRYSYCLNNPLRYTDPDGLLTIIIHGTYSNSNMFKSDFVDAVAKTFNEQRVVTSFQWSGGDTHAARAAAAKQLANFVNKYQFKEGEKLNMIGYSHGGNVGFLTSQEELQHTIDNLVSIGTPIREYRPNSNKTNKVYNIYSESDKVQIQGGNKYKILGQEYGPAGRKLNQGNAVNIEVKGYTHSTIYSGSAWRAAERKMREDKK